MRHQRFAAFTLIELLVVIAIIALLVSILLPSLKSARDLTRAVVCGTNLKGIHQTMVMYQGQWDGFIPALNGDMTWGAQHKTENGSGGNFMHQLQAFQAGREKFEDGQEIDSEMFFCPIDTEPDHQPEKLNPDRNSYYPGKHPFTSAALHRGVSDAKLRKLSVVRPLQMQPKDYRNVRFSEIIAFTAGRGNLIPVTKNGPKLQPSAHGVGFQWWGTGRHNGGYGLNAAYFDGHVRYIKDFRDDFDRVIGHLNWSYWD